MIQILDDVLPDSMSYLYEVRWRRFGEVAAGPATFKGIAIVQGSVIERIAEWQTGAGAVLFFYRRSPLGQVEPNFVHSNEAMGQFTAIYYLNPDPPEGDGTAFWKRGDDEAWKMTRLVPARFNRLLIFDAGLAHSRALFDNYGQSDDARLIQVSFLR